MTGDQAELIPAEAAAILNVSPSTVRRYEAKGWLKPKRRLPSGHRRYSRDDVQALKSKIDAGEFPAKVIVSEH